MKISLPKGFYHGSREGYKGSWQGKLFYPKGKGINVFLKGEKPERLYPFKYYTSGKTIAVDYNVPGNPLWLRMVLDELTLNGKGKYDGRLTVRILGVKIPLARFSLSK